METDQYKSALCSRHEKLRMRLVADGREGVEVDYRADKRIREIRLLRALAKINGWTIKG